MNTKFFNSSGKVIGTLKDNVLRKKVLRSKHLFRKLNAWGIQNDLLQQLPDDCKIEILEKEDKTLYTTSAKFFRDNAVYLDLKHGLQGFMTLDKFEKIGG